MAKARAIVKRRKAVRNIRKGKVKGDIHNIEGKVKGDIHNIEDSPSLRYA